MGWRNIAKLTQQERAVPRCAVPYSYDEEDRDALEQAKLVRLNLLQANPELERLKTTAIEQTLREHAGEGESCSEGARNTDGVRTDGVGSYLPAVPDVGQWIGWTSAGQDEHGSSVVPAIQVSSSPELTGLGSPEALSRRIPAIDSKASPPNPAATQRREASPFLPILPVPYLASPPRVGAEESRMVEGVDYVPSPGREGQIGLADPFLTWSPHPFYLGRRTCLPRCMECEPEEGWIAYYQRKASEAANQSYYGIPAWQIAMGAKAAKAAALVAICL